MRDGEREMERDERKREKESPENSELPFRPCNDKLSFDKETITRNRPDINTSAKSLPIRLFSGIVDRMLNLITKISFHAIFFLFSRVYALSMELKDSAIQISISIHTNPQVLPKVPNICQKIVLKQTRAKEHFVRFVFIYWGILFVSTIITIYKVVRNIAKTGNVGL